MESSCPKCLRENHGVEILNFSDGQEVCYSVVVVLVKVRSGISCSSNKVEVKRVNGPWCTASSTFYDVSPNSNLKCILRLEHGSNTFMIKYCSAEQNVALHFRPRCTPYCVLPVYVVCKGHDGRFQAPENEDNSIDSACDRIDTGLRLLQSLFAERLYKAGYGRQTFQLQTDTDPMAPDCHVFYSNISVEEAYAMPTKTLWACLGRELMESHLGKETHKFVAFLSCTMYEGREFEDGAPTYDDILACTRGHVALGGGGLALVGTGCLHTWASSTEEVVHRFQSSTPVDTLLFMDDSHFRGTFGGCFATTLGAVCHELGHTFDLGHTNYGIMGAGYHDIHCLFLPEEDEWSQTIYFCEQPTKTQSSVMLVQDLRMKWSEPTSQFQSHKTKVGQKFLKDSESYPQDEKKSTFALTHNLNLAWSCPSKTVPTSPKHKTPYTDPVLTFCFSNDEMQSASSDLQPLDLTNLHAKNSEGIDPFKKTVTVSSEEQIQTDSTDGQNVALCSSTKRARIEDNDVQPCGESNSFDCFDPVYDVDDVSRFWPKSCLALLAYNKWINSKLSTERNGIITFDRHRKQITSNLGMRVVDLRDDESKSVLHWKFEQSFGLTKFSIPENLLHPNLSSIVVIDSGGNVLKDSLLEL